MLLIRTVDGTDEDEEGQRQLGNELGHDAEAIVIEDMRFDQADADEDVDGKDADLSDNNIKVFYYKPQKKGCEK